MHAVQRAVSRLAPKRRRKACDLTPPGAPVAGDIAKAAQMPSAVSVCLQVLSKRSDFLKAAKAPRQATTGFVLQARRRAPDEAGEKIRIGYTCSKKVGNAVARNRAKRRLREVARQTLPQFGNPGWDYVLIGRANITARHPYSDMCDDLQKALSKLHQKAP